jgi:hypothetical protein
MDELLAVDGAQAYLDFNCMDEPLAVDDHHPSLHLDLTWSDELLFVFFLHENLIY